MPALRVNHRLLQAPRQQAADDFIRERFHPTVGMMDDEPLACAKKLVADHKRANGVVAGAAAGITNHVRIAFPEAGELCRIQSRVHASQNREPPRRRHAELAFSAKAFAVGAVGGQYFINNSTHRHYV
jgi:hypothetical protein